MHQIKTKLTHLGDVEKLFPEQVGLVRRFYFLILAPPEIDPQKGDKK